MKNIVNKYLSKKAIKIEPYQWDLGGKNVLQFNSNTLPFPPRSLQLFLREMAKSCSINEYTDPNYSDLKKILASYEKVGVKNITVTNSGDEAIDILAKTFLNPGEFFVVTPPTYDVFCIQCEVNNGIPIEVPLRKTTWEIDAEKIIDESKNPKTKIIFLCNPNNPTGSIIPPRTIEKIIQQAECIVVTDETYREFYGKTSNQLIKKYNNVVILRSLSKFASLAGARVGYLVANPLLSQKFDGIRFPMGVSYLSYKLAEIVLENDQEWIKQQISDIKCERAKLKKGFENFGFIVYPSNANFLLVNIGTRANEIYQKLKKKNVNIRDRSSKKYLEGCVRITVRSRKENIMLLAALDEILSKDKYAFIDRDGTLIFEPQDTYQIDDIKKLKILDGVIAGLKKLIKDGYKLVMISNQDGLGTNSFPKADFNMPQNKMLEIFRKSQITFDKILICPHLPIDNCSCRKPKIGLVKNLIDANEINKDNSFVCGDRPSDKLFAKNMGIRFVPIKTNSNFYDALVRKGVIA